LARVFSPPDLLSVVFNRLAPSVGCGDSVMETSPTPRRPGSAKPPGTWTSGPDPS